MAAANTDNKIELTQGKTATVSAEDFDYINQWKWSYDAHNDCAVRSQFIRRDGKKQISRTILMHSLIMGTPKGKDTDHINGDRLDNRRHNLRICTHKENQRNMGLSKANKSGYKGVSWDNKYSKWVTRIRTSEKYMHVGYFKDRLSAAKAYNEAAKKYHGEFARLNKLGGV
jgi:hypothetical protein